MELFPLELEPFRNIIRLVFLSRSVQELYRHFITKTECMLDYVKKIRTCLQTVPNQQLSLEIAEIRKILIQCMYGELLNLLLVRTNVKSLCKIVLTISIRHQISTFLVSTSISIIFSCCTNTIHGYKGLGEKGFHI